MPGELDASVVVPARDAGATLADQLAALAAQETSAIWEVIVADNGSTDDTVAVARRFGDRLPGLRVVDASHRRGVAAARNAGARSARGRLVCFCDADDVVAPDWLATVASALGTHDAVSTPLRPFRSAPGDLGADDVPGWVTDPMPYLTGCSLGIRADVLARVGGFDEDWDRGAAEDVELSLRLLRAGARLGSADGTVVHRRERPHVVASWRQHYRYGHEVPRIARAFPELGVHRPVRRQATDLVLASMRLVVRGWGDRRRVASHALVVGRLVGSVRYRPRPGPFAALTEVPS